MRKNVHGFTLVELLAAIVLLGILLVLSVPYIKNNILQSKNKVYVSDAEKIISLAEYKLSSNSRNIEKPDPGNGIILGFDYLNDGSIKDAPDSGEYESEYSFVLVKNNSGKMDYYVSLINKTSKGNRYKGIELASKSELNGNNANSVVKEFNPSDLIIIDNNSNAANMASVINGKRNILNSIDKIYLNDKLSQGEAVETSKPIISSISTTSEYDRSNSKYRVNLSVSATDKDDSTLVFCVKSSDNANDSYPAKKATSNSNNPITDNNSYCFAREAGNWNFEKTFVYNVSSLSDKDKWRQGQTKYFYVSVFDSSNNKVQQRETAIISKNEKPVINSFVVSKRDSDKANEHIVKVSLDAKDDLDDTNSLKVCINQSRDSSSCKSSDYKSYNTEYSYTIRNSSGELQKPDGNSYDIYVHVKDSFDDVTVSGPVNYTVGQLSSPSIEKFDIVLEGTKSLYGNIDLKISDIFSHDSDIKFSVKLDDKVVIGETSYSDYSTMNKRIKIADKFDGSSKTYTLNVRGKYSSSTKTATVNVYRNVKPVINSFSISGGNVSGCDGVCIGTYEVRMTAEANDDLDSTSSLLYCVYEDGRESDCKNGSNFDKSKFKSFNQIENTSYTFYGDKKYRGEKKELNIAVMDTYGEVSTKKNDNEYHVYTNQAPEISGSFAIESFDGKEGSSKIKVIDNGISINDDFNNYEAKFCYKVQNGSDEICTTNGYNSYNTLMNNLYNNGFTLVDKSDVALSNSTINAYLVIRDKVDTDIVVKTDANPVSYSVYVNNVPQIVSFDVNSNETGFNANKVRLSFKVSDPGDTYKICINDKDECEDYQDEEYNGSDTEVHTITHEFDWNPDYEEEDNNKTVYLFVNDGTNVVKESKAYQVYLSCKDNNYITEDVLELTDEEGNVEISQNNCGGKCYNTNASLGIESPIVAKYNRTINYFDKYKTDLYCKNEVQNNVLYGCGYYTCFGDVNSENSNAIGITLRNENEVWDFNYSEEVGIDEENNSVYETKSIQCHGYYNKYNIKVMPASGNMSENYIYAELLEDEKICPELVSLEGSIYRYVNGAENAYIRFDDSGYGG